MTELKAKTLNGIEVIDSRDVAEMVERSHGELLKNIRTYLEYLAEGDFPLGSFFIDSTYIDRNNQVRPNYYITRKGCDMIANKMTGKKGVLFTAAYVTAFEEMEQSLKQINTAPSPELSPGGFAALLRVYRRSILDLGGNAQDVSLMMQETHRIWNVPIPKALTKVGSQLSLFDSPTLALEG